MTSPDTTSSDPAQVSSVARSCRMKMLAVRIAAGREQEQRAASGVVQLAGGELERLAGEVGKDGFRVPELSSLELPENVGDRVHTRIMACARSTISRTQQPRRDMGRSRKEW